MVSEELSEAVVELNTILENTSPEVLEKIPEKFIKFMKSIASTTYQFEYDKTKPLEEQNIKPKTKGLIALIYKDFLCDEKEKQEYLNNISKVLEDVEQEKRKMYNPDDIFKKKVQKEVKEERTNNLSLQIKQENLLVKIISFIKRLFGKK